MIDTFVFDVARVLLHFSFSGIMRDMGFEEDAIEVLCQNIREESFWIQLDQGTVAASTAEGQWAACAGEYAADARYYLWHYYEHMTPIAQNARLLEKLRAGGYRLYFLSNFHGHIWEKVMARNSFFSHFDGGVVSWEAGLLKPDMRIYTHICEKYGIVPENAVFIDDNPENTAAAERLGFQTITYDYYGGRGAEAEVRKLGAII